MKFFETILTIAACSSVLFLIYEMVIAGPERDRMKQELIAQERAERFKKLKRKAVHAEIDLLIASIPQNEPHDN